MEGIGEGEVVGICMLGDVGKAFTNMFVCIFCNFMNHWMKYVLPCVALALLCYAIIAEPCPDAPIRVYRNDLRV